MTSPTRILNHLAALGLVALMAAPSVASAEPEQPTHPRRYRVVHTRRVIVVRPPPPPRHRRVEVIEAEEPARDSDLLGMGLRVSGTALDGGKLGLSDVENPAMAGFGLQLRSKVSENWGLELSADYLSSSDGDTGFKQTTIPVMLSGLFFLFPDSPINPYGLVGGGVHFTTLSYMDGLFEHHILEVAGQLGAGVQVKLGRRFAIHADVRFLTVYKNLGETTAVSSSCLQSQAGGRGFCDGLKNLDPSDKFNIGAQFQAGATYFF